MSTSVVAKMQFYFIYSIILEFFVPNVTWVST